MPLIHRNGRVNPYVNFHNEADAASSPPAFFRDLHTGDALRIRGDFCMNIARNFSVQHIMQGTLENEHSSREWRRRLAGEPRAGWAVGAIRRGSHILCGSRAVVICPDYASPYFIGIRARRNDANQQFYPQHPPIFMVPIEAPPLMLPHPGISWPM